MKKIIIILFAILSISKITFAQNPDNNYFEISKNLDIYYALFKEVNENYVDPIQPGKMVKTSIDKMLDNLDPYTNYITEDDIEDYRFQTTGKYGGIGCGLREAGNEVAFDELFENGPAYKSGIRVGDILVAIDGKTINGLKDDQITKLIKGSAGSTVKFKVRNPISKQESEKLITREEIQISNIPYNGLIGNNKEFAYVRLSQFTERATTNIKNALDSLKKVNPNVKGIVLDLRGNPGGLLDEAVDICNLFINKGQLVVSTKGKTEEKEYKTKNAVWDEKIPVVVMVNKGSASASEIVSGTLQDLDRGVVVGQRSYGKGLVQNTKNLPFNSKLKVTTAKYYTPSGRCIQALDYTHRNEDGSVGEVADSLKKQFATKNGRKVYDGGGVEPDVKVILKDPSRLASTLNSKNLIFDYATEYVTKHTSIAPAASFELSNTDMDDFFAWIEKKDFNYKTKSEESLEKLKEIAIKEKYFDAVKKEFDALATALFSDKKQDLIKNKNEIKKILQAEIVTRYYFQKGRAVNDMIEDADLKEAILILGDVDRYNKILSGK